MTRGRYEGPPLDGTVQYLGEAPYWRGEGETVDVVDDEPVGEERTENVPIPDGGTKPDDRTELEGQTTIDDWEARHG